MQIVLDRQALHRIPELDRDLPCTLAYLRQALAPLRCACFSPSPDALCAYFDFGAAKTIAFRSDMDALPIEEASGLPFASTHAGQMHACGHDGHMAILLELARRLDAKASLPNNILLIFQPAEETTGGALEICQSGVLAQYGVSALFGLHLWPGLPAGEIFSRPNEMMSRASEMTVTFHGLSAHIAKPHEGRDALAAAHAFYQAVTEMEQALPPSVYRLCRFGHMVSGTVRNAISDYSRLEGCLRAFQEETFLSLQEQVRALAQHSAEAYGCTAEVQFSSGYPAVLNPPALFAQVAERMPSLRLLAEPSMTSEDFSWYQHYVPALFFFLGLGDTPPLHSDHFQFDDTLLLAGADFFDRLTQRL